MQFSHIPVTRSGTMFQGSLRPHRSQSQCAVIHYYPKDCRNSSQAPRLHSLQHRSKEVIVKCNLCTLTSKTAFMNALEIGRSWVILLHVTFIIQPLLLWFFLFSEENSMVKSMLERRLKLCSRKKYIFKSQTKNQILGNKCKVKSDSSSACFSRLLINYFDSSL